MEDKIDDIEYAIDNIDSAIDTLKKYKQYEAETSQLKDLIEALEFDLEELMDKRDSNNGYESQLKEDLNRYWRDVI